MKVFFEKLLFFNHIVFLRCTFITRIRTMTTHDIIFNIFQNWMNRNEITVFANNMWFFFKNVNRLMSFNSNVFFLLRLSQIDLLWRNFFCIVFTSHAVSTIHQSSNSIFVSNVQITYCLSSMNISLFEKDLTVDSTVASISLLNAFELNFETNSSSLSKDETAQWLFWDDVLLNDDIASQQKDDNCKCNTKKKETTQQRDNN